MDKVSYLLDALSGQLEHLAEQNIALSALTFDQMDEALGRWLEAISSLLTSPELRRECEWSKRSDNVDYVVYDLAWLQDPPHALCAKLSDDVPRRIEYTLSLYRQGSDTRVGYVLGFGRRTVKNELPVVLDYYRIIRLGVTAFESSNLAGCSSAKKLGMYALAYLFHAVAHQVDLEWKGRR